MNRVSNTGKAIVSKSTYYDVDPYPKYEQTTVASGSTATITYQNGVSEMSKVKRIRFRAPAGVMVSVKRQKDGQDQTVMSQRAIETLPMIDGWYEMEFRSVTADAPLTIDKNQTITLEFSNSLSGTVTVTAEIDKEAYRFYETR